MRTIIEKTYKPTTNPCPDWRVSRKVTTRIYVFDRCDSITGEVIGETRLWWKHDTDDKIFDNIYHGCSYRFSGYNPTPCTDWFRGVPLNQMFDWCKEHDLYLRDLDKVFIDITYKDISWEATHPDF